MSKDPKQETKNAVAILEPIVFDLSPIVQGSSDLNDNLSEIDIRLPQIKIIHQACLFEMPDGQMEPSFSAIMIDFNRVNSWWKESFTDSGGGSPPQCFSIDGVRPSPYSEELQADYCQECKKNAFGSEITKKGEQGRGKACKNLRRVHVLCEPNQLLPYRLTLPPSNLKAFDSYISALVGRGFPWRMIQTLFKLKPVQNKEGIKYAELVLVAGGAMPMEQVALSKKIADKLMPILRDKDIRADEYDGDALAANKAA